jgi:hypothetical protein
VDQAPDEHLDRRFREFREGLRQNLRADLRQELGASPRQELRAGVQELGASLRQELRADVQELGASLRQELRTEIAASAAETRLHFDVVAERLMGKIQLVDEGVIGVDQKVDRRFLHLEARVIAARD